MHETIKYKQIFVISNKFENWLHTRGRMFAYDNDGVIDLIST